MLMWLRGRTTALALGSALMVMGIALMVASRSGAAGAWQGGEATPTAVRGTPASTRTAAHSPTRVPTSPAHGTPAISATAQLTTTPSHARTATASTSGTPGATTSTPIESPAHHTDHVCQNAEPEI